MKLFNSGDEIYTIIDIIDASIYWKDLEGRYLGCNQYMVKMAGMKNRSDIIGKTDKELPWYAISDELARIDQLVLESGHYSGEETPTLGNDIQRIYQTKKTILRDKDNKSIGIIGVSIDITNEKQAEIAKLALISNMGHDLKSPFIGIEGYMQILRDHYAEKDPEIKEFWDQTFASIKEIRTIIDAIIEVVAMEHPSLKFVLFSINQVIEAIQNLLLPTAHSKNLELVINKLDPNESDLIETDELSFKLILNILVTNAIEFTDKGKITLTILNMGNYFHIKVTDTGIGIPREQFEYIFEPFTKLSLSNKHNTFQGIGGGLYSAQIKAQELGGIIVIESEPGKGSTFTLILPTHPPKK